MPKTKTTKQFIIDAKRVHGEKFDYSKVDYTGSHNKVLIICKKHGTFLQKATNHLAGKGCKQCSIGKPSPANKRHVFFEKSKKIHNNKYKYLLSNYVDCKTKIIIICPVHGKFEQTPERHLLSGGCINCLRDKQRNESFVRYLKKFKRVHGNKYDYSQAVYKYNNVKIKIICTKHGPFYKRPTEHAEGRGCSKCNGSLWEMYISDFLNSKSIYFIRERSFKTCKNRKTKKALRFDFYLPELNILIEYDGDQHRKPDFIRHGNLAIAEFKKQKFRDKIKTNWARKNGIKLHRLRSKNKNNLHKTLNKIIKNETHYNAKHYSSPRPLSVLLEKGFETLGQSRAG